MEDEKSFRPLRFSMMAFGTEEEIIPLAHSHDSLLTLQVCDLDATPPCARA